jgi:hypothetical protein
MSYSLGEPTTLWGNEFRPGERGNDSSYDPRDYAASLSLSACRFSSKAIGLKYPSVE